MYEFIRGYLLSNLMRRIGIGIIVCLALSYGKLY